MKAKEYLQQIKTLSVEIKILEHEINELYSPISAVRFDNVPGVPDPDATLHIVERIGVLQDKYRERVAELIEKRNECVNIIQQMENERTKNVIYNRYVLLMSFRSIAKKMSYSYARIMQLHHDGLNEVETIISRLY